MDKIMKRLTDAENNLIRLISEQDCDELNTAFLKWQETRNEANLKAVENLTKLIAT